MTCSFVIVTDTMVTKVPEPQGGRMGPPVVPMVPETLDLESVPKVGI